MNNKGKACSEKLASFLRLISIGQVNLGLFYKQKLAYTSVIGGIFSILIVICLAVYSYIILIDVFDRSDYSTSYETHNVLTSELMQNQTISTFLPFIKFRAIINKSDFTYCNKIEIYAVIKLENETITTIGPFAFSDWTSTYRGDYSVCGFNNSDSVHFRNNISQYINAAAINTDAKNSGVVDFSVSYGIKDSSDSLVIIILDYNQFIISDKDFVLGQKQLSFDKDNTLAFIRFTLIQFSTTESILQLIYSYTTSFYFADCESNIQLHLKEADYDHYFQLFFDKTFTEIRRTPNSIYTALAEIGGLFAFVKIIALFFKYIHQRRFVQSLMGKHMREFVNEDNKINSLDHNDNKQPHQVIKEPSMVYDSINESTQFVEDKHEYSLQAYNRQNAMTKQDVDKFYEFYSYSNIRKLNQKISEQSLQLQQKNSEIYNLSIRLQKLEEQMQMQQERLDQQNGIIQKHIQPVYFSKKIN